MLQELKFVQGAVAKKDFVPELTHFHIQNGVIKGFNGRIALKCPIDLELDVCPKATPFIKAIQACKDTTQLYLTPAKRLAIRSGKFKAFIECLEEAYPDIEPEGEIIPLDKGILSALKELSPFIAEDASRPWARGILLRQYSAYATNNIILIEKWLGYPFPVEVNIPKDAIAELLRINEEPHSLQLSDTSVTFHFSGDRWLRTQLYSTQWPELSPILDHESNQNSLPDDFFPALKELLPFANELVQVFFTDSGFSTTQEDETGAKIELEHAPATVGCFNIKFLLQLEGIINTVDFSTYPNPCLFYGDDLRGAIIGMRL